MELTEFPNEIHHHILSYISCNRDLANIVLVSHLFKNLAEPLLYKTIYFKILSTSQELAKAETNPDRPDITLSSFQKPGRLVETLTARPNLGSKTYALTLEVHRWAWYMDFSLHKLLRCLPKLGILSLTPPPMHSVPPMGFLQSLTSVQLDFRPRFSDCVEDFEWYMGDGISLSMIATYMSLRNLRRVQCRNIDFVPDGIYQQYSEKAKGRHGGSFVDDLCLLDCNAYGPSGDSLVADLILSTKHLKRLVFEMNGGGVVSLRDQFKAIGCALTAHDNTLEELVLAESNTSLFTTWAMGSLKGYHNLKRLAIPFLTTFGDFQAEIGIRTYPSFHEYLPPQLEELQIQSPVGHSEPAGDYFLPFSMQQAVDTAKTSYNEGLLSMQSLADNKSASLPGLKTVIWWFQQPRLNRGHACKVPAYRSLSQMDDLAHAFREVGVKFEWISSPVFKETPFGQRAYQWEKVD